jgi:hypothetical protein
MIELKHNFLEDNDFFNLADVMFGPHFPWFFQPRKVSESVQLTYKTCQYTHMFYDDNKINSNFYDLIIPLIEKLNVRSLIRVKANMTIGDPEPIESGMHVDFPYEDSKTAVFYLNSNNGYTLFENGKQIPSEQNSIALFESQLKHCGVTCTDEQVRVVININYF